MSRWIVINSNDKAATPPDRPASASNSNPSTSSLRKDGTPCASINASSVVTATSTDSLQDSPSQPTASRAAAMNASERVEIVGLSVLILIVALPGVWPIADGTSVTAASRPNSSFSVRYSAGCGSTATTPAPRKSALSDPLVTPETEEFLAIPGN